MSVTRRSREEPTFLPPYFSPTLVPRRPRVPRILYHVISPESQVEDLPCPQPALHSTLRRGDHRLNLGGIKVMGARTPFSYSLPQIPASPWRTQKNG